MTSLKCLEFNLAFSFVIIQHIQRLIINLSINQLVSQSVSQLIIHSFQITTVDSPTLTEAEAQSRPVQLSLVSLVLVVALDWVWEDKCSDLLEEKWSSVILMIQLTKGLHGTERSLHNMFKNNTWPSFVISGH